MVSSKAKWEVFFKDAGIPSRQAAEYATTFSDNRIRLDMLDELSKELLQDLGIKALGDVIAILRHGKVKIAEMKRSPSPEIIEKAIPGPSGVNRSSSPEITEKLSSGPSMTRSSLNLKEDKVIANPSSTIKITTSQKVNHMKTKGNAIKNNKGVWKAKDDTSIITDTAKVTSELMKSKPSRLTLSRRFGQYESEAKRQKLIPDQEKRGDLELLTPKLNAPSSKAMQPSRGLLQTKGKAKGTTFTIQLPTTKPPIASLGLVKPVQKVTVVPALGKALNRTKDSTSIFDRLDASSTSTAASLARNGDALEKKKTVFNRLGTKGDKALDSPQKVQAVTGIVRTSPFHSLDSNSKSVRMSPSQSLDNKSKSVFKRLGDR